MNYKEYFAKLGFSPKSGTANIYFKEYSNHHGYSIEIDLSEKRINYGQIKSEFDAASDYTLLENCVRLDCIDRLLEKGYKPQNIILEKTWRTGHNTSGRLDIYVTRDDSTPYLLIECKTFGKEFEKELAKTKKDGGQLFTYFQLSGHKADVIMLYASEYEHSSITVRNEIIKIEEEYRSGEVSDIYEKWNKLTKDNGIFDSWVTAYNFESKALTKSQLKEITSTDASFIFNRFLEILRHSVVSDKGNAFNKIFTLFLCKVYDETTSTDEDELRFQWKEGVDNHIDFQLRLTDLYKDGMKKFLERTVSDFDNEEFNNECGSLLEETKKFLLEQITKLRLEKNNEFAIKEVYDRNSFEENAKVVKEVVELIQGYRLRYNKRQQYLSDFFELLLTTGLKQEAGQFFTPVPIAQFIIRSLPLDKIVNAQLTSKSGELLPYMIDYAAGSGHFITEYMHEVQRIVDNVDTTKHLEATAKKIKTWQNDHFDWATEYVYGVEKDYRLVKVGKVGCYLHGDGLANVILSDGLANFNHPEYKGKLKKESDGNSFDNPQFDVLLSNPPYSVSSFRQTTRDFYTEKDFELYSSLTDNSSEIEALFVERMKQLLKPNGIAGIVLPSSILNNTGIYTKTREIILQYFEVVAIAELGSNTFMATNTSTVVLFLRRRNNAFAKNIKKLLDDVFIKHTDITINSIEKPLQKYVNHVWEGLALDDYFSLLKMEPTEIIKTHPNFEEYKSKIKTKKTNAEKQLFSEIIKIEKDKLFNFIVTYPQRIILIKSGSKNVEKRFLGYEFSNRRGSEGIHSIQHGKDVSDCTQLFDLANYTNMQKASSYIYRAFQNDFDYTIDDSMVEHVSNANLYELLTFDRKDFEKTISTSIKKKINFKKDLTLISLSEVADIIKGVTFSKNDQVLSRTSNAILTADNISLRGELSIIKEVFLRESFKIDSTKKLLKNDIFICFSSGSIKHVGKVAFVNEYLDYYAGGFMGIIRTTSSKFLPKYIYEILNFESIREEVRRSSSGSNINNLSQSISEIKIPYITKNSQKDILSEIEEIDKEATKALQEIEKLKDDIEFNFIQLQSKSSRKFRLSNSKDFSLSIGKRVLSREVIVDASIPVYSANVFEPFGMTNKLLLEDFTVPSILWGIDGDWMVNFIPKNSPFYPTDHCGVLRVLNNSIHPRYLSWALHHAGKEKNFSRTLRASIERVGGITLLIPSTYQEQEIVILEVERIERTINLLNETVNIAYSKKNDIIRKHLT